jgi:hypothetical protein
VDPAIADRRRFLASLVAGQLAALLGLLLFGGVLLPMVVAFIGSAAGCFVVAEPRRLPEAASRLQPSGPQQHPMRTAPPPVTQ